MDRVAGVEQSKPPETTTTYWSRCYAPTPASQSSRYPIADQAYYDGKKAYGNGHLGDGQSNHPFDDIELDAVFHGVQIGLGCKGCCLDKGVLMGSNLLFRDIDIGQGLDEVMGVEGDRGHGNLRKVTQ